MLHPITAKLVEEVFTFFDEHGFSAGYKPRKGPLAKKDPEACLVSLLQSIKERLPVVSAMLHSTVDMAIYDKSVEEARKLLRPHTEPSMVHKTIKRNVKRRQLERLAA